MTALTEKRILGIRNGDEVLVPPMEWDPATGAELAHDFVEVGPAGTVESWTWVPEPSEQHPLDRPFAFAFIRLDGATTPLLHAVDAGSPDAISDGVRVAPRWQRHPHRPHHRHRLLRPRRGPPRSTATDTGPAERAGRDDGLPRLDHLPEPGAADARPRASTPSKEHRLLGLQVPDLRAGLRRRPGLLPDRRDRARTESTRSTCPQTGTITNFTIVTPVQYPGQTETEPFVRVFVLLDGTDVILGYQPVIELPADGRRTSACGSSAVWASPGEEIDDAAAAMGGAFGNLLGWIPNGEPDVDDPDLVNRIF